MKQIAVIVASLGAVVAVFPAQGEKQDDQPARCVLLDGTALNVRSLAIDDERVTGVGTPTDLSLDDLRLIALTSNGESSVNQSPDSVPIIALQSAGELSASKISIAAEKITIHWQNGPPLELPIDFVRGLQLELFSDHSDYEKSLATPPAALDRVLVRNEDGQFSSVSGLVFRLDHEKLTLQVDGQDRSLPRAKIRGIVFAQPAPHAATPRFLVTFRDGSRLGGDRLSLTGGNARLSLGPQSDAQFNWSTVDQVTIRSSRLAYLSDLTPLREMQTPIVTLPLPAQRDKSVSGGPLKIGAKVFDKGLGVHSRSAITFNLNGQWDLFAAKIGLDEAADGKGDCIFQLLADGKSIFERRISGKDSVAQDLNLPLTGCRELTLIVEPGAGLDMADHANWCDARLIRNKK